MRDKFYWTNEIIGETGFILHMAEGHFQNGNEDGGNSGQKNTIL